MSSNESEALAAAENLRAKRPATYGRCLHPNANHERRRWNSVPHQHEDEDDIRLVVLELFASNMNQDTDLRLT